MKELYFILIGALVASLVWAFVFVSHSNQDAAKHVNTMTHALERSMIHG